MNVQRVTTAQQEQSALTNSLAQRVHTTISHCWLMRVNVSHVFLGFTARTRVSRSLKDCAIQGKNASVGGTFICCVITSYHCFLIADTTVMGAQCCPTLLMQCVPLVITAHWAASNQPHVHLAPLPPAPATLTSATANNAQWVNTVLLKHQSSVDIHPILFGIPSFCWLT